MQNPVKYGIFCNESQTERFWRSEWLTDDLSIGLGNSESVTKWDFIQFE